MEARRWNVVKNNALCSGTVSVWSELPLLDPIDRRALVVPGVVQVKEPIVSEVWMQHQAEQPSFASGRSVNRRHRLRLELTAPYEAEPSWALRHQHVAARKESQAPGYLKTRHDRFG